MLNFSDDNRILNQDIKSKVMSAEQAAQLVKDGMVVATSGFTPAGYPKAVPMALANRAKSGEKIGITVLTGASVGPEIDKELTEAGVIKRRFPYQTNSVLRNEINLGNVEYSDLHLSHMPLMMKNGIFGDIDLAIVEAVGIDENGNIYPTTSIGTSNVAVETAKSVIVEINTNQPLSLIGVHDIYSVKIPPNTEPIPITSPEQRIGTPYIPCDPEKIVAVVITDIPDRTAAMEPLDDITRAIAKNLIGFLQDEVKKGRMPKNLNPIQSGVGKVANAILSGLIESEFEHLRIYSEVLQDSTLDLLESGKLDFASATSFTFSPGRVPELYEKLPKYRDKLMLRPQEISNHPEVIRRLGLIAINTALEADIYGNVNSTHVGGTRLMNGIGGSGDFTRNAGISIFTTASTAKGGLHSCIVPSVTHVDHNEHSVQILITEYGVADLRALGPVNRAKTIIENCVHPKFRPMLESYLIEANDTSKYKHIPLVR